MHVRRTRLRCWAIAPIALSLAAGAGAATLPSAASSAAPRVAAAKAAFLGIKLFSIPAGGATTGAPPPALRERAAAGDAAAQAELGKQLMSSKSPVLRAEAFPWLQKSAAQGNAEGEYALGLAYFSGNAGAPRDIAKALAWMRKSMHAGASAGHMFTYGLLEAFYGGDWGAGMQWVRRSAESGSTNAMLWLAVAELRGNPKAGIGPDKADAHRWLLKAAQLGNADAETMVGQFNIIGGQFDIQKNVGDGLAWLTKAATQGYSRAQGLLGVYLVSGDREVPKNPVEGVAWAQKAVEKYDPYGYYALGLAYQQGVGGVSVDPAQAWYNFAAAQRTDTDHAFTHVQVHLSEVGSKLSATELDDLQARVLKIPLPKKSQHG